MSILGWLLTLWFLVRLSVMICRFIAEHILSGDVQKCRGRLVTMSNVCQNNHGSYEIEILELNGYRKNNGHAGLDRCVSIHLADQ
jgi:hypothetical protein